MYILEIQTIISIHDITPGSPEDRYIGGPMESISFQSADNQPTEPSKGIITASIELLEGVIPEKGGKAWFLNKGFTLNCSVVFTPGSTEAEIFFNQLFIDGFQTGMADYLVPGTFITGMSEEEWEHIGRPDMQEQLFQSLASIYLPDKKEQTLHLARMAYIIRPAQEGNFVVSHFSGDPKLGAGDKIPVSRNKKQMIHVATFKTDEIKGMWPDLVRPLKQYMGFYVALDELENGWTGEEVECCVLNYENIKIAEYKDDLEYGEEELVTWEERLDLPDADHAIMHALHLSDSETQQYEALKDCWEEILDIANVDVSKLLGYPDAVQECVAYEAERLDRQSDLSDDDYNNAAKWLLLLQLSPDSADLSLFEYLGSETFYFMIRKEDFERGHFGDVRLILQNT